jgi:hypothetical protein
MNLVELVYFSLFVASFGVCSTLYLLYCFFKERRSHEWTQRKLNVARKKYAGVVRLPILSSERDIVRRAEDLRAYTRSLCPHIRESAFDKVAELIPSTEAKMRKTLERDLEKAIGKKRASISLVRFDEYELEKERIWHYALDKSKINFRITTLTPSNPREGVIVLPIVYACNDCVDASFDPFKEYTFTILPRKKSS